MASKKRRARPPTPTLGELQRRIAALEEWKNQMVNAQQAYYGVGDYAAAALRQSKDPT